MKILETERLILREMETDDAAFIFDLLNQPSFIKYIGNRNVHSLERAEEVIKDRYLASYRDHGYGLWAVELKPEPEIRNPKSEIPNQVIGMCGFVRRDGLPDADIGFAFLPQFERKGYAFESASAVMEYGRNTLGLRRVLAITSLDNESSIRLLGKLGFKFDGLINLPHSAEQLRLFSAEM
ncbi:MAG TPA: GNAT family N-acetyltransferase [Pyrinomonadaceae bacterium]|jgi:RimJ/RimL family protein N-acetyltransferase